MTRVHIARLGTLGDVRFVGAGSFASVWPGSVGTFSVIVVSAYVTVSSLRSCHALTVVQI